MAAIVLCTILGFLAGFSYVVVSRRHKLGPILTATILGIIASAAAKAVKDSRRKRYWKI